MLELLPKRGVAVDLLTAEDAERCAALHGQSFVPSWSAPDLEGEIARPDRVGAALRDKDGELHGFALSRFVGEEADLLTIVVDSSARGQGWATNLLSRHLQDLADAGVRRVFLEVGEDNRPALRLYARCGFVPVGRRAGYYGGANGQRDAAVMRRDLP